MQEEKIKYDGIHKVVPLALLLEQITHLHTENKP